MPLLELRDVRARYGGADVLHDVSLDVGEGEAVALLGANGAGKTTTLRVISGTVACVGRVSYAGRALPRRAPEQMARLGVAHVPQGRGTFAELSVRDNLRLGGYTRTARAFEADLRRIVGRFPWLAERASQPAGTLSGGEQGMLALARALVQRPRLILLDEPSLGLAPTMVSRFFELLRAVQADEGLAVLLVEQNARVALGWAARGYVLEAGRVASSGSSDELSSHESLERFYLAG